MKIKGGLSKMLKAAETSTLLVEVDDTPFGPTYYHVEKIEIDKEEGVVSLRAGAAVESCAGCERPIIKKVFLKNGNKYHRDCVPPDEEEGEEDEAA